MMRPVGVTNHYSRIFTPNAQAVSNETFMAGTQVIGENVLDAVRTFGPPDLVQTTDAGHEWRWYDASGIDRDALTDDDLRVVEILVSRPKTQSGRPAAKFLQPAEAPYLEQMAADASIALETGGAKRITQAAPEVAACQWRDGVLVGRITSGAYGHTLGRSVGMGYVACADGVDAAFVERGRWELEIAIERCPARAQLESPYDPKSARVRE